MKIFKYIPRKITFFFAGLVILGSLNSCSGGKFWDPADARKVPANVNERVNKNLEEGRGFSIGKAMLGGSQTTYHRYEKKDKNCA